MALARPALCWCADGMTLQVVELHSPLSLLVVRDAVRVRSDQPLTRAAHLMRDENVSALLVDDPSGIISERDMTGALAAGLDPESTVAQVATPEPLTVAATHPIVDAAAIMLNQNIRHLVVRMPNNRLGIVSLRAILAVLLQAAQPEIWHEHLRLKITNTDLWIG